MLQVRAFVERCVEIAKVALSEGHVRQIAAAGGGIVHEVPPLQRRPQQHSQREGRDHHQRQGGPQPAHPSCLEGSQCNRSRRIQLDHEQAGDQKSREDEEDVHADESTGGPGKSRMERHDGQHCQTA